MAINLLPPDQISAMTDFPTPAVNATGFMPHIQAQVNNVLDSPAKMPPEYVKPPSTEPNMLKGMQKIAKNLSAAPTTPGWNFKDSGTSNLIRMQNRANAQAKHYKDARNTLFELAYQNQQHEKVKYQELLATQSKAEQMAMQSTIEAKQRIRAIRNMRIDPSRFFKSQGSWDRILGFIGTIATGSVMKDMGLDPNMALVGIQNAIQQDIALQLQERQAAQQEHTDLTKLDKDSVVEQIQLLRSRRELYTDRAAIVADQFEEVASFIDNSEAKNALTNSQKDLNKIMLKESVDLWKAEQGLVASAGMMEATKAQAKLLEKSNMAAVSDQSIGQQGWTIVHPSQKQHDPYLVAEREGKIPDIIKDPANPKKPLANQGIAKASLRKYLGAKQVENEFAGVDTDMMLTIDGKNQKKEMLVESIDDFNTYNVDTGNQRYSNASGVLNLNGKKVYVDPSIDPKLMQEKKAEFDGAKGALSTSGKIGLIVSGMTDRMNKEGDGSEALIKDAFPEIKEDDVFGKPEADGKRYFKHDFLDLALAKAGIQNIFKKQGGESVLQELRVIGVHYSKLVADMVPFVTSQKPGARVSDNDIKLASDIVGKDLLGPFMMFHLDPRGALNQMKSVINVLMDYQVNNINNKLSNDMATPAQQFSTEIRGFQHLDFEDKLKKIQKGLPRGSLGTSTKVGDTYGQSKGIGIY